METLILGPMLVTGMVFSTYNSDAKKSAFLATYKQTGIEENVNSIISRNINKVLDKNSQSMIGYTYQIVQMINTQEVTIGFQF